MEGHITYKILRNFINGKYSWNEYSKVKTWFTTEYDFETIRPFLQTHWNELNDEQQTDDNSLRHVYEKIEYRIFLKEKRDKEKKRLFDFFRKVAAILLIPVLTISLYWLFYGRFDNDKDSWVEIHAPNSARIEFSLPDGSSGWINSGTVLKYHPRFVKNREVELTGEAYFEVKSADDLFTVNASDLNISVLGTKFNVSAYADNDFLEVVLEKGKVRVDDHRQEFERTLSPGEKLKYYHQNNTFEVVEVNTESYTLWRKGFLLFNNEPFEQAAKKMERWYNVDIVIEDELLKNYRFKATFKDESLEEVLKLLSVSTPMKYAVEKREVAQEGTYKETIVRIKRK